MDRALELATSVVLDGDEAQVGQPEDASITTQVGAALLVGSLPSQGVKVPGGSRSVVSWGPVNKGREA